ncbi:MAG: hypothetical protein IK139_01760 [Lachnospiraceae bacterium]|nr:hypothetical protein [Lachnospiraceae bacterium]
MSMEQNRISDDELDAVSGGYIVQQDGKYYVVDRKGNLVQFAGKKQEGYDKLNDARYMALIAKESLTEITMEQWDDLKTRYMR